MKISSAEVGDTTVRELYSWMRDRLTEAKLPRGRPAPRAT
jgi:hypothetical protein